VTDVRAVHLDDERAYLAWARMAPFVARPYTGPPMCGVGWCVSYADARTGEPAMHREWKKQEDGTQKLVPVHYETPPLCVVHRERPGFQPKRFTSLGRIGAATIHGIKKGEWKTRTQTAA
jgi:hypothetical protein